MDGIKKEIISTPTIPEDPEELLGAAEQLQTTLMMYSCAIREFKTKIEVLNDELSIRNQRNPIEFIKTRVKTPYSIFHKLKRKGFEVSLDSVREKLFDVAGVRIICSFVDDIYDIAGMITKQDDIRVLEVKDYIKNPKPNGYRSLHMICQIPVFFSDRKELLSVEVQIRTIAMDFWASLEHDLRYKKELPLIEEIQDELRECAETIATTDLKMMEIRDKIQKMTESRSEIEEDLQRRIDGE